jgi:hypothetical protein
MACSLPLGLAFTMLGLLALQLVPCDSIGSASFVRRSCSVAPASGTNVRGGLMRLRGGIEYYENRMDVQEAIQALKQALFLHHSHLLYRICM